MVDAMMRGEREHLAAFVNYISSNRSRRQALIDKNWRNSSIYYNGAGGVKASYPEDMKAAYDEIVAAQVSAR